MFERILRSMQDCVRDRRYVMTIHAEEEMVEDGLSIFDIEHALLNGTLIEKQKDQQTDTWKYLVRGRTRSQHDIVVVARPSLTGTLVIITVFRI